MGRGRQKAKQTKVARKLKYFSPETDYEALQRELQAQHKKTAGDNDYADDDYQYEDYDAYDDDDESWRYNVPPATD